MKKMLISLLLFCFLCGTVFAADEKRLNDLIGQLKGGSCKCENQLGNCVKRKLFASFLRRHDKEQCIVDAARILGSMGPGAKGAVPALIEALRTYRNIDTGDGIIPVRSAIAAALGRIQDPAAIKPLIEVFFSDDPATLSSSASVPQGYKIAQGASYAEAATALGMFGSQAKEALPVLRDVLSKEESDPMLRAVIEEAVKEIER